MVFTGRDGEVAWRGITKAIAKAKRLSAYEKWSFNSDRYGARG